MAVLTFTPLAFGATASGSMTQDAGGAVVELKRFRSIWRATCDSPSDDPEVVFKFLAANKGSYPWYGTTYTFGNGTTPTAVVKTIDAEVVENSNRLIDVHYGYEPVKADGESTDSQPGTSGELTTNPLEWLEEIDVYYTQTLAVAERGIFHGFSSTLKGQIANSKMSVGDTLAITNSACIPYDPSVEVEKQIKIIRISRNVPEYDGPFFDTFNGSINSDRITIDKGFYRFKATIAERTGKISVSGVFQRVNGIKFWRQTTQIEVDYDGWRKRLLDRGMSPRRDVGDTKGDGSGGTFSNTDLTETARAGKTNHATNKDDAGYPIPEPVLFDGRGQPLRDETYPPVYGEWGVYREVPWAGLAGRAW